MNETLIQAVRRRLVSFRKTEVVDLNQLRLSTAMPITTYGIGRAFAQRLDVL